MWNTCAGPFLERCSLYLLMLIRNGSKCIYHTICNLTGYSLLLTASQKFWCQRIRLSLLVLSSQISLVGIGSDRLPLHHACHLLMGWWSRFCRYLRVLWRNQWQMTWNLDSLSHSFLISLLEFPQQNWIWDDSHSLTLTQCKQIWQGRFINPKQTKLGIQSTCSTSGFFTGWLLVYNFVTVMGIWEEFLLVTSFWRMFRSFNTSHLLHLGVPMQCTPSGAGNRV